MRNLRIHPNYHQFTLLEPHTTRVMDASLEAYAQYHMLTSNALALLECAKANELVVLLTLVLEDSRWHHWHVKVPPVTTTDAVEAICNLSRRALSRVHGPLRARCGHLASRVQE